MDSINHEEHKKVMKDYVLYCGNDSSVPDPKTDWDILEEEYRFIRTEEDNNDRTWRKKFAKAYYDKLFRNFALADLSRYEKGKVGLRWRSQEEVFEGKGQFICGADDCTTREGLKSYEVNFSYVEDNQQKSSLVKLRVCPQCAYKLHYKKLQKDKKEQEKKEKKPKKEKKKHHDKKRSRDAKKDKDKRDKKKRKL